MKNKLLTSFVLDNLQSIEQHLSSFIKEKKPKYLHRLRVDIKEIKAVYSFSDYVYKKKYNTGKLQALFDKAGKIRELQINIHLLSLFPRSPKRLIYQLKLKVNTLIQQFIKKGQWYIEHIADFRKAVCFPEKKLGKKIVKRYFKKVRNQAAKTMETIDRGGLHRYRIKIKKLMYVYKMLPQNLQKKIRWNEVLIKKQQHKLGEWHDTYSAVNFLSQKHFPKRTTEYISKLKDRERHQFNVLYTTLTSYLK